MNESTPNPLAKFLEQKYGKKLTDDELIGHKDKLVQFFSLLMEIDQKSKRKNNETKTI